MGKVYEEAKKFVSRYPMTIAWRLKSHAKVIDKHINADEEVLYVFTGQYNGSFYEFFHTAIFVVTNKRMMIATARTLFGYFFYSITPDMFNDLTIRSGILWGNVIIDTIKEVVTISNLDKRALNEIEDNLTKNILEKKPIKND